MTVKPHLAATLLALSLLAAAPAFAQDTQVDNDAEVQASVPADRIADRYADSLFDGDKDAATAAVKSLREGGDVTIEHEDGTTSTLENTNGPMGYGEVNIALGMAEKLVDSGDAEGWQDALNGAPETTDADGNTIAATEGVLQMRADGMGWGKIAKELGFSLGSVVGKAPTRDDKTSTTAKADRTTKTDRATKPDHAGKPEKAEQPDRVAKVERVEKPERVERVEKPERPDKPERGGGRP